MVSHMGGKNLVKVERSSKLIDIQEEKERNKRQHRYEQIKIHLPHSTFVLINHEQKQASLHLEHTVEMRDKYPFRYSGNFE